MDQKRAVIIGAGPAGLTAAYELATRTNIKPVVLEKNELVGGISKTVDYKGNRIDIGGHRFFSKSDRVLNWWLEMMPVEGEPAQDEEKPEARSPSDADRVMLVRRRKSRIYFLRKLFDYPINLSMNTFRKLGPARAVRILFSYLRRAFFPLKEEENLEQFFINRFGRELYTMFFKSYTEKLWGVPCVDISASWGAQRVKGLSLAGALRHFVRGLFSKGSDVAQKDTETSLIERFYYPKLGPGQMWELVAEEVRARGGEVLTRVEVDGVRVEGDRVTAVEAGDRTSGKRKSFEGEYFFSTMPVKDLVRALEVEVPPGIREISEGLIYRDFITVGLLLEDLKVPGGEEGGLIKDNWIYMQEPGVDMGRIQIFNNWSPYLVKDPDTVWVGLEYFCNETDEMWKKTDRQMIEFAAGELERIGFCKEGDVLDATVIREPKTYPAYFGTYNRFGELREFLDRFDNLFLIGRNGMHRYNNQDHSMLTAMIAVDNISHGEKDRSNIWAVNVEQEYHETE